MTRYARSPIVAVLLAGGLAVLAEPLAAQSVGSVGSVNPSATGNGSRTLSIGSSIANREQLKTSATGTLRVVFNDKTTMNLGPNASMTVDKYVYNPSTGSGSLQATMKSGLMRYVGGQTSHNGAATVKTPVSTIGIRGIMATFGFDPTCGWRVISLAPGSLDVSNAVSAVSITRPNFTVCVASATSPIPEPVRVDPAVTEAAFLITGSRAGQSGGATQIPTEAQAGRRGLGSPPLPNDGLPPLATVGITSTQGSLGSASAQSKQPGKIILPPSPRSLAIDGDCSFNYCD